MAYKYLTNSLEDDMSILEIESVKDTISKIVIKFIDRLLGYREFLPIYIKEFCIINIEMRGITEEITIEVPLFGEILKVNRLYNNFTIKKFIPNKFWQESEEVINTLDKLRKELTTQKREEKRLNLLNKLKSGDFT